MNGQLQGDKLSWRRTKFKLVAYVSNFLGSDNVKYNVLGEGMKEVLGIAAVLARALTQLPYTSQPNVCFKPVLYFRTS